MSSKRPAIFDDPDWLTTARLKRRGWNFELIIKLLGEGERQPNPIDPAGPPLRLYQRSQVEAIEDSPEFHQRIRETKGFDLYPTKVKGQKMRQVAQKEAHDIRERARERLKSQGFELPLLSRQELERQALLSYEKRHHCKIHNKPKANFIHRQCVNYLRHHGSPYDHALNPRVTGVHSTRSNQTEHLEILQYVLSAIAHGYPYLRSACEDKLRRSHGNAYLLFHDQLPETIRIRIKEGRQQGILQLPR